LRHWQEDSAGTTRFLWDFNNYLAETDVDDDIQAVYTNEPQPYGNLISQYRKGPTLWLPSYYYYDALGSARELTDDAGVVTDTYVYDAWGNAIASTGSAHNPFRWVGQVGYYWDEGTGTFYIRARMYDPVTGRWMSQDPLFYPVASTFRDFRTHISDRARLKRFLIRNRNRYLGGNSNLYEHVGSNPSVHADASGESPIIVVGAAAWLVHRCVCNAAYANVHAAYGAGGQLGWGGNACIDSAATYLAAIGFGISSTCARTSYRATRYVDVEPPPAIFCKPGCFQGARIYLPGFSLNCRRCEDFLQLITTIYHECIHAKECHSFGSPADEKLAYCNEHRFIDQVLRNNNPGGACASAVNYDDLIDEMANTAQQKCNTSTGVDRQWPTDRPPRPPVGRPSPGVGRPVPGRPGWRWEGPGDFLPVDFDIPNW
jgi:RHS repeat-associated protein